MIPGYCYHGEPGCACDIADVPCKKWVRERKQRLEAEKDRAPKVTPKICR